jgi:hypothetical protein
MQPTATLAGFFAAHAVWCVSDGETLVPMFAVEKQDGSQEMHRLVTDRLEDGVAMGRDWLETNHHSATRAALIYDGYITMPSGKIDALLVEARKYEPQVQLFAIAVPYRHADSPAGFAVHRPKLIEINGDESQARTIVEAFFEGVDRHEKGAEVWDVYLDESL